MKLTPEMIAELKTLKMPAWLARKDDPWAHEAAWAINSLIADLEEARGMAVALAPDALREAEERKNIADGLEAVWRGRMQDAETAHQAELAATRKLLAEAQALLKRLSPLMINAGYVGANAEIQRSLRDVRVDLVRLDTPALNAAIAEAIEPYRKDAERLDLLGKLCKETPLRPNAFCSEIAPDTRLKYEFPTLVSYDAIGQQISLRDAIDAAIAAKVKNE